jgi:prevent-host-death family protein
VTLAVCSRNNARYVIEPADARGTTKISIGAGEVVDGGKIGGRRMADAIRKSRMKEVPLSEAKDDLSHWLREAEKQDIVITRHGEPAGVLIGFKSEDDWFEYRLLNDPRFLKRIESARKSVRAGKVTRLEDVDW